MILIAEHAASLKQFLDQNGEGIVDTYKIFVRLNFRLDVYLFASEENIMAAQKLRDKFLLSLGEQGTITSFFIYPESLLDDPDFTAVTKGEKKIDYGPRFRFDSFLDLKSAAAKKIDVPVVTFYSYKGGMGRTTTMMAYAMHLAENQGKNVVVIDCDLEAPGYLNFFGLDENPELLFGKKNGFVEFACDLLFAGDEKSIDIDNYIVNAYDSENGAKVWVVPAGNLNESSFVEGVDDRNRKAYLEGLAKLNLSNTQMIVSVFDCLIRKVQESGNVNVDVVLIDSRTGFNDIFGMAVLNLSCSVVGFFGRSRQTNPGFMNLLRIHRNQFDDLNSHEKFKLHIVYSILPEGVFGSSPEMKNFISLLYKNIETPDETSIHRNEILELIGTGDEKQEEELKKGIKNIGWSDYFGDYKKLFEILDKDLNFLIDSNLDFLANREIILSSLKKALRNFENFFYFRDCHKQLFDKSRLLILGADETGRNVFYDELADSSFTKKLVNEYKKFVNDDFEYRFINIAVSDIAALNVKRDVDWNDMSDSFSFWQEFIWESLLGKSGTPSSKQIEKDLITFDEYLHAKKQRIIISFNGVDLLHDSKKSRQVFLSLVQYWKLNNDAFDNVFPKVFVNPNLLDESDLPFGNLLAIRKRKDPDYGFFIDWNIDELLDYLFKLANSKMANKDAFIDALFGQKVVIDGVSLGKPRDYLEKTYSSGNRFYVLLRPFEIMLNNSVNACVGVDSKNEASVIPSEVYASKELIRNVKNQYMDELGKNTDSSLFMFVQDFLENYSGFAQGSFQKEELERVIAGYGDYPWECDCGIETTDDAKWVEHLLKKGFIDMVDVGSTKLYCFVPIFCKN